MRDAGINPLAHRWRLRIGLLAFVIGLHAAAVMAFQYPAVIKASGGSAGTAVELHFEMMTATPSPEPLVSPQPERPPEPQPEPQPALEPEPEPESEPEPKPKQTAKPKVASKPQKVGHGSKASSAPRPTQTTVAKAPESHPEPEPERLKISELEYASASPRPAYPERSKRIGERGLVVVRVLIGRTGRVETLQVLHSSQHKALDDAALEAMKQVRFKPYRINGIPKRAMADIPFNFVLR